MPTLLRTWSINTFDDPSIISIHVLAVSYLRVHIHAFGANSLLRNKRSQIYKRCGQRQGLKTGAKAAMHKILPLPEHTAVPY